MRMVGFEVESLSDNSSDLSTGDFYLVSEILLSFMVYYCCLIWLICRGSKSNDYGLF